MAHFHGKVIGKAASEASRNGSKKAGLETATMSWDGVIRTVMWHDEARNMDMVRIVAEKHPEDARPHYGPALQVLYEGPVMAAWLHRPKSALAA